MLPFFGLAAKTEHIASWRSLICQRWLCLASAQHQVQRRNHQIFYLRTYAHERLLASRLRSQHWGTECPLPWLSSRCQDHWTCTIYSSADSRSWVKRWSRKRFWKPHCKKRLGTCVCCGHELLHDAETELMGDSTIMTQEFRRSAFNLGPWLQKRALNSCWNLVAVYELHIQL